MMREESSGLKLKKHYTTTRKQIEEAVEDEEVALS